MNNDSNDHTIVKYKSKEEVIMLMLTVTWEFVFASGQKEVFWGFIDTHKSWVWQTPDPFKSDAGEYIPQRQAIIDYHLFVHRHRNHNDEHRWKEKTLGFGGTEQFSVIWFVWTYWRVNLELLRPNVLGLYS